MDVALLPLDVRRLAQRWTLTLGLSETLFLIRGGSHGAANRNHLFQLDALAPINGGARRKLDILVERIHGPGADRVPEALQIRRGCARRIDIEVFLDPDVVHMVLRMGRLDHDQVEVLRIETVRIVHGAIEQADRAAQNDHGEVVKGHNRCRTRVEADLHGLELRASVRQELDLGPYWHRLEAPHIVEAAESRVDCGPDACFMGRSRRLGINDLCENALPVARIAEGFENDIGIAGGSRRRGIRRVGEDDGAIDGGRLGDGAVERDQLALHSEPLRPELPGQPLGLTTGDAFITVRHHQDLRAEFRHVGERVADHDACGHRGPVLLDALAFAGSGRHSSRSG